MIRPVLLSLARPLWLPLLLAAACGKASPQDGIAHAGATQGQSPASAPAAAAEAARPKAPSRGPEHAVFSLADNRLLAHVQRDGGVLALAGSPAFAKYVRFGRPKLAWKLLEKLDGKRVAIADTYAAIDLPLTAEQSAGTTAVWVRLHTETARRMSVSVNGKLASTVELAAGWQTAQANVPAGQTREGENNVMLSFAKGSPAAVEWIQLGGAAAGETAPVPYDAASSALVVPRGHGLAYYVKVPEKGLLTGDVHGAGCQLAVTARAHDGPPVQGTLVGDGSAVDLAPLAGKIARLDVANSQCQEARLVGGALVTPGPAARVQKPLKPKYVVLWIMDSLRADRIKTFFPAARPDVPTFDRLAETATTFRNAYVQGNESRASHASIWSALFVANHRMIPGGEKTLLSKFTTLGEAMKAAGFFTTGVSSNGYITKRWGFGDGWDAYRNHIHDGGGVRGEDILKYGFASIEPKKASPFFLYLGTIDTHVSWRAKEPWFSKYAPGPYAGRFKTEASGKDVELMATGKLKISEQDKARIVAIYDSNVSYQDALLDKFMKQLETWGILEDTMIVITADHGDEQWEDGRVGHGSSLRESLVHVPLLVYYPPLFPAGIVEEGVDTVDILPTMLDATGLGAPEDAQGESLIPLAQGVGQGYPRPSFSSQYEDAYAMRLGGWKARVASSGIPTLFHVEKDPYEKQDLAGERPLERRFLTDSLSTFLVYQKQWKKQHWGVVSNASPRLAADLEK